MRERSLLHTITSIWSISDRSNRDPFIRHPFVVCAWRFKHLQEMILSGKWQSHKTDQNKREMGTFILLLFSLYLKEKIALYFFQVVFQECRI